MPPLPRRVSAPLRQSLAMGGLAALIGVAAGLWVWRSASGDGYGVFAIAAPLAAFAAGTGAWWLLRARRGRTGALGGAVAGAAAAVVGHWLCWYGILVGAWLCHAVTGGCTGTLGEVPMNPLLAFAGASLYGALSLVFVGWFTVPAGALAGAVLGRRPPRDPAATDSAAA